MSILLVALGGFFGSVLRFYISIKTNKHLSSTWIANVSGSILLAVTLRFYLSDMISHTLWLLIGIGFCGAYTTFSTFGNEMLELIINKKYGVALGYTATTFGISLLAVFIILIIVD